MFVEHDIKSLGLNVEQCFKHCSKRPSPFWLLNALTFLECSLIARSFFMMRHALFEACGSGERFHGWFSMEEPFKEALRSVLVFWHITIPCRVQANLDLAKKVEW